MTLPTWLLTKISGGGYSVKNALKFVTAKALIPSRGELKEHGVQPGSPKLTVW